MRPITNEDIKVLGRIVNISTENVVADASQVYDSNLLKDQQWLNDYFYGKTGNATTSKYGIVRLAVSKNDPDNNDDVPTIKILRDAINDAIDDLINGAPGALDTFRELADALNNNPNFYTWVTNQLALKADKSVVDNLLGRVDNLEQRITVLEECCQQMHEYVNEFSVTWNQARGGNHVTITPGYVRIGSSVVEINMDPNYVWEVDTTNSSQLHTLLENCMDGDYDSFTITNVTRQAGFVKGMTLNFAGVRSNITINGNVYKLGTVTAHVTGGTASPTSQMWGNPVTNTRTLTFSITASSGYTTNGTINWALKDQSNVTVATNNIVNSNNNPVSIAIADNIQNITCFEDYTLEVIVPASSTPTTNYTVTKTTSHVTYSGTDASTTQVASGDSYNVTVAPASGYQIDSVLVTMGGTNITSFVYNSGTGAISISNVTGNIVITVNTSQSGTTPTYGTVTISPDHGTASPATCQADGTSHTITITPAGGYTTTGMTATSNNNDVSASVSGNTITVTGTSSSNATITVNVPAESVTPSSPATITIQYIDDSTNQVYTDGENTKSFTETTNTGESFFMYIHQGPGNYWVPFGYNVSNVTVIMNGVDVTNNVYDDDVQTISIASITGNTSITIYIHKLLSTAYDSQAKFDAFGRVYNGYGQLNTDPYNYGSATQSIKIAALSDFDGLSGATDTQKLEDLKSKTSVIIGGNAGRSVYNDHSNTMNIITNSSAPFHAGQLYLSGQDVMVDVTCDPTDFTSGSVDTSTPTMAAVTQSQQYSTRFTDDINAFSDGGWANILFVIDSTTQEGYYATLIRGIYQLVGASGSGVSEGIHWLYLDPANSYIVPVTAFEEIQVTCDNPSAVISTTYSGSNSTVQGYFDSGLAVEISNEQVGDILTITAKAYPQQNSSLQNPDLVMKYQVTGV